jgi:hypothetical protein
MTPTFDAEKIIPVVLAELDQWGGQPFTEPFVAAAHAYHHVDGPEFIFICRTFTHAGSGAHNGGFYASYLSPYGQIVAKRPGQSYEFTVERNGYVIARHHSDLLWKCLIQPKFLDTNVWDGSNARLEWVGGGFAISSLRSYDSNQTGIEPIRQRQLSVQLPDQAILDEIQDTIFRLPLNERVLIFGAPGTGKTTVQLKRLSQKTKWEFLTAEERQLFRGGDWKEQDWILFTPNDLLKYYLKEALAKEHLPASDAHLKVYGTLRQEILRECGVLRVTRGVFRALPSGSRLLTFETPESLLSLKLAFDTFLKFRAAEQYQKRIEDYRQQVEQPLAQLERLGIELVETAKTNLKAATEASDKSRISEAARGLTSALRARESLNKLRSTFAGPAQGSSINQGISHTQIYSHYLTVGAALNESQRMNDEHSKDILFRRCRETVENLTLAAQRLHDALSLRTMLDDLPRSYQRFRLDPDNRSAHFAVATDEDIESNPGLSLPEQDFLLLHLLDSIREISPLLPKDRNGVPKPLGSLLDRLRANVCIDEVADFTPLEVACMEKFALPRVGGVTLSGDLMQRVTQDGLRSWDDLHLFSQPFNRCELTVGYRQSERLFRIAKDLCTSMGVRSDVFHSAYQTFESDPPPLMVSAKGPQEIAQWLTERVFEIFEVCGDTLPTIAILMPTKGDINPLFNALQPRLSESGIELEESSDGKKIGDSSRVRIFPVEAIKGLEFEAVFYVSIDRMAELHAELIDKFLYVGLSRARSFLGITVEDRLPESIRKVEKHFEKRRSFQGK